LLEFAINGPNQHKSLFVQTFDETVVEGSAALKLYSNYGFIDFRKGDMNAAGLPTVKMQLVRLQSEVA
jgi:hypothetical protein